MTTEKYKVGKVWIQFYGNGMRMGAVIKTEKYNVELAGFGTISKKRLINQWHILLTKQH